jgi:hypothetical protein
MILAALFMTATLDPKAVTRFADLALACVHREYPNKISHVLNSDADAKPPRQLTPAFYGCYDWHSAVHAHWLLARLARTFPDAPFASSARAALAKSLTTDNIAVEVAYMRGAGRASFERPYGLAWLLQLAAELRQWDGKYATGWSAALAPLEAAAVERLRTWLPKLSHPVRIGEHAQSAFSVGLILDWARVAKHGEMTRLLESRIRAFYERDRDCPIDYEPSGEDFLSPCLAEADAMRRVMSGDAFARWLATFLPSIPTSKQGTWLTPAVVTDPTDPKLAHLDGLNLSRAWMLEGIARALPRNDSRVPALERIAAAHRDAGLRSVTGEHYEGGHWLGTFAVYLVTERGIR